MMFRLFLVSLLSASLLSAQFAPVEDELSDTESIRYTCISWNMVVRDVFTLQDGERTDVLMSTSRRSAIYRSSEPLVEFFKPGSEGDNPVRVASVRLKPQVSPYLLVFFPGKKAGTFRILPISDGTSDFSIGEYKFVNFSNYDVGFELGGEKVLVKKKSSEVSRPGGQNEYGTMDARYAVRQDDGAWKVGYDGYWPWRGEKRTLVFLTPDESNKRDNSVLMKLVTD